MKKAIVTLVKRTEVTDATSNSVFRDIFEILYSEIETVLQYYPVKNYSLSVNGRNPQLKKTVDEIATTGSMNSIFKLNGFIPGLWDSSHRINLKVQKETGQLPNVWVEVIEFISGEKDKLQIAIYFETEDLVLLDNIGDKLLLAFPNTTGEDDATQTYFTDTFFIQLTDDLYFKDYKLL